MNAIWCGSRNEHGRHDPCPGNPSPEMAPTAEQWVAYLRGETDEQRAMERMQGLLDAADRGRECFMRNHDGLIEVQRETIAEMQVRINDLAEAEEVMHSEGLNS